MQIWIMLLPVGYIRGGYWWALWPYFWLALLLLACDELATQLEVGGPWGRMQRGPCRGVLCMPQGSGSSVPCGRACPLPQARGFEPLPICCSRLPTAARWHRTPLPSCPPGTS